MDIPEHLWAIYVISKFTVFHVFIFISASSSCVHSLTVCDLTDWVRTEGHYSCLHCLCLKFLRCTIDGKLEGKSWDFQETVKIVELYRSRFLMHGHFYVQACFSRSNYSKSLFLLLLELTLLNGTVIGMP